MDESFSFKIKGDKSETKYFADYIVNHTIDLTPDGERFYIVTWTENGKEYQSEYTVSEVEKKLASGVWMKIYDYCPMRG